MAFIDTVDFYKPMNASVKRRNAALEEQGGQRWDYERRAMDQEAQQNELARRMMEAKLAEQTMPAPAPAPAATQIPALAYGTGSAIQTKGGMTSGGPNASGDGQDKHWTNRLRKLLTDPSAFERTPGFKAALDTGRQAIERSAAARGMGNSGNTLYELMKFGTGLASQEYGGQVDRLSRLSQYEQGNPEYWKNTQWGA